MTESVVLGTVGLSIAALIALVLTVVRDSVVGTTTQLRGTVRLSIVTLIFQTVHFAEELATGFYQRFPELLGLTPWSVEFFISFNLFWLTIWALSIWGVHRRRRAALFPLWFLALTCVVNGLAHPLFAARSGRYFPGLVSSLFVGIAGVLLLRALLMITGVRSVVRGAT